MRRIGAACLGALMGAASLTGVLPGASPTASAEADDIVAIVIDGTGFGHGRGLSQWGAYGWAVDEGKSWEWILDHYFGGTTLGDVNSSETRIQVKLTKLDGAGTVGLLSHGDGVSWNGQTQTSMYAIEDTPGNFTVFGSSSIACPSATTLTVPSGSPSIGEGSTNEDAVTKIQSFLKAFHNTSIGIDGSFGPQTASILTSWQAAQSLPEDGTWDPADAAKANEIIEAAAGAVTWTELGTATGTLTFTTPTGENSAAPATSAIGVCSPNGFVTHYRGAIEVSDQGGDNRVVNDVKTEDYLRGVVPKEIAASWATAGVNNAGENAVRAQAVAARSYGLQESRWSYAGTCDTTSCQVYGGAATRTVANGTPRLVEDFRSDSAIAATAGKIRRWPDGRLVRTEFSASNGPRTAGGAFPPVDDTLGDSTSNNPNHRWTRVIDADQLETQFGLGQITDATMVQAASSVYQDFDGIWFNDIVLTGVDGTHREQAWDFRRAFNLPSPGFTVRVIKEATTPKTFGFIGDSVGNSIAQGGVSEFDRLIDGTFTTSTIDVRDGRCTTEASCPGSSGVEAAEALPLDLDLVVVELGYNDDQATFAADIDAMMSALEARNVRKVAWINLAEIRMRSDGPRYRPQNEAIIAAASARSNLEMLDWESASDHEEALDRWYVDGVHLTITGQAEFALWLREKLLELSPSHYLAPPKQIELSVIGRSLVGVDGTELVVPVDAAAVSLNVTAVRPSLPGFATVWPCSNDRPEASNLNYAAGQNVANSVIAPVGGDGKVCLYADVGTEALIDVSGWFSRDGVVGVTPTRFVDTRIGQGRATRVTPTSPLKVSLSGENVALPDGAPIEVPAAVSAFSLNVTAVRPSDDGFLTVWPCDLELTTTSNVNYVRGRNVGIGVLAPVAADGSICVYSEVETDVLVDLLGWIPEGPAESSAGTSFTPVTPQRLVDTRLGLGGRSGKIAPADPLVVPIHGAVVQVKGVATPIPDTAAAVSISIVALRPDGHGFATVWPCAVGRPEASNLNYRAGEIIANGVIAPIDPDGTICLYTSSPSGVLVDVFGWFPAGGAIADGESGVAAVPTFTGAVPKRFVDTRFAVGPIPV